MSICCISYIIYICNTTYGVTIRHCVKCILFIFNINVFSFSFSSYCYTHCFIIAIIRYFFRVYIKRIFKANSNIYKIINFFIKSISISFTFISFFRICNYFTIMFKGCYIFISYNTAEFYIWRYAYIKISSLFCPLWYIKFNICY